MAVVGVVSGGVSGGESGGFLRRRFFDRLLSSSGGRLFRARFGLCVLDGRWGGGVGDTILVGLVLGGILMPNAAETVRCG